MTMGNEIGVCNYERLAELCADEFERAVDKLFAKTREDGFYLARTPITHRLYDVNNPAQIHKFKQDIRAALAARVWFRQHGPLWAPPLPLNYADCEKLEHDADPRIELVGHYAFSLRALVWDYKTHPLFVDFCRGLMAYARTPSYLKEDPELLAEFPPRPLAGIDAGLRWCAPEELAEHRAISEQAIQQLRDQNVDEATLKEWTDEHESYFGSIST
jgi:hypothetical protein